MLLQGVTKKGKRVAVSIEQVAFATEQEGRTLLCMNGQWVSVDVGFSEVLSLLEKSHGTHVHKVG